MYMYLALPQNPRPLGDRAVAKAAAQQMMQSVLGGCYISRSAVFILNGGLSSPVSRRESRLNCIKVPES